MDRDAASPPASGSHSFSVKIPSLYPIGGIDSADSKMEVCHFAWLLVTLESRENGCCQSCGFQP
jgi:hypothetical protein